MLISHRIDTFASDRFLIHIVQEALAMWVINSRHQCHRISLKYYRLHKFSNSLAKMVSFDLYSRPKMDAVQALYILIWLVVYVTWVLGTPLKLCSFMAMPTLCDAMWDIPTCVNKIHFGWTKLYSIKQNWISTRCNSALYLVDVPLMPSLLSVSSKRSTSPMINGSTLLSSTMRNLSITC